MIDAKPRSCAAPFLLSPASRTQTPRPSPEGPTDLGSGLASALLRPRSGPAPAGEGLGVWVLPPSHHDRSLFYRGGLPKEDLWNSEESLGQIATGILQRLARGPPDRREALLCLSNDR
jgi:hypothetical protein